MPKCRFHTIGFTCGCAGCERRIARRQEQNKAQDTRDARRVMTQAPAGRGR